MMPPLKVATHLVSAAGAFAQEVEVEHAAASEASEASAGVADASAVEADDHTVVSRL